VSQLSSSSLLRDGIAAAKAGDKALTRRLLREAVQQEPTNEAAWLWLAGVGESPQDTLASLERVLEINPANERARAGLASAQLQAGIAEAKLGNKATARRHLTSVTEQQPGHELAWLWLAGVAEEPATMMDHLQRVLDINPHNARAREGMKSARLQVAIAEAKAGNKNVAHSHLTKLIEQDPRNELAWQWLAAVAKSNTEALDAWHKVKDINPKNDRADEAIRYYETQEQPPKPVEPEPMAWECPLCSTPAVEPRTQCEACGSILSLTDIDAHLSNSSAHQDVLEEAVTHYETALRQQGDFATHYYLGLAFLNLKNLEKAVLHFGNAARLKPRDRVLRSQLEVLSQRLKDQRSNDAVKSQPEKPIQGRVLIVDDSPTVRKLVSMTMEKNGYMVTTAADGYEAADRLLKGLPDLILLDIAMPGMDGYQVCKLIKENKETAKIPVIMLSGKDGFFDKLRGRMAGSTAYITKPFKPEELVETVHKYCNLRHQG
jgi:twitching motility two-component system response regulator PilG